MLTHYPRRPLDNLAVLTKIWFVISGIYIWEFVTNLDYEWSVIRGRRPYRWTIWVYSMTRVATLTAIILNLIVFSVTSPINCQVWATFLFISSFLSLCTGSLLILLRVFAIWHSNKIVKTIAAGLWVANASVIIWCIARIRAVWVPLADTCSVTNLGTAKPSFITLFVTDFLLLLTMLAGLLRLRRRDGNTFELGRLLWRQGILWLAISSVAELLQIIFLILNLTAVLDGLFLVPAMITLAIASTRLYRSLADFSSPVETAQLEDSLALKTARLSKRGPFVHVVSSNRLEVTVHKDYEEHPMPEISYPSSDTKLNDKPHQIISFDDNTMEGQVSRAEK